MSRKYSIEVSRLAIDDIFAISDYIAEQTRDPEVAAVWEASLYDRILSLEQYPLRCGISIVPPYRKLTFGRYLVFFRIIETDRIVLVCRVVHSARLTENIGAIE